MALVINNGDATFQDDYAGYSQAVDRTGGIMYGGITTVSGTNSLTLIVGSTTFSAAGSVFNTNGNTFLTVAAAGSSTRMDLLVGSANGSIYLIQGNQLANPQPALLSGSNALMGYLTVGSNVSTVSISNFEDKRFTPSLSAFQHVYTSAVSAIVASSGTYIDIAIVTIPSGTNRILRVNGVIGNQPSTSQGNMSVDIRVNGHTIGLGPITVSGNAYAVDGWIAKTTGNGDANRNYLAQMRTVYISSAATAGSTFNLWTSSGTNNLNALFQGGSLSLGITYSQAGSATVSATLAVEAVAFDTYG